MLPLVMNSFTAFGRGMLSLVKSIRQLIPDETTEPKGMQEQLKVTHGTCMPLQ